MKPKLHADGMPRVPLPGLGEKSTRRPEAEDFELQLPDGSAVRVEGWVRDRRFSQDVRVSLPDGRVICVEGFREGWFVWPEADPDDVAGGSLVGCIASTLGTWPDWPDWVEELADRLYFVGS
jgi:hypothetical protein